METAPLFHAENTQSQGIVTIRDDKQFLGDHVKIRPWTGIGVFESARTRLLEVQVPSRQPGNSKSRVRISRGIEQYTQQFFSIIDRPPNFCSRVITAVSELRATASTGNRW